MANPYAHAVKRLQDRSIAIGKLRMDAGNDQAGIDLKQVLVWMEELNTEIAQVVNDLGNLEERLFNAARSFRADSSDSERL